MRLPRSPRARFLTANLVVVGVALGTVLVAVSLVGPGYFSEAMGHRPDDPAGQQMDAATLEAFGVAVRTALLAAAIAAVVAAIAVAWPSPPGSPNRSPASPPQPIESPPATTRSGSRPQAKVRSATSPSPSTAWPDHSRPPSAGGCGWWATWRTNCAPR